MTGITITLLGTNGWYSSQTGNTLSLLLETGEQTIILDAGDGIHKIADLRPEVTTPAWLFLSHLHLDHISGLHTLSRLSFSKGLVICVPPGTSDELTRFIGLPFTVPLQALPYRTEIRELPVGTSYLPFPVTTGWLVHTQPVYGYRFDLGKIITFCTDTGPCETLLRLAAGADLLITECSNLPGQFSEEWPHLSPEYAISAAENAGAKQLLLVHFSANLYTSKDLRRSIRKTSGFPGLIIGEDDMVIRV